MPSRARVRQSLDLPAPLASVVASMAAERDCSQAEIIRAAGSLLVIVEDLKKEGYKTGGWKILPDGQLETVQIILV